MSLMSELDHIWSLTSPIGYIKPNITFTDELKINIAGVDIELSMRQ